MITPLTPLERKQLIFALGVYVPLPKRAMQLLTEETMLLPSSEDFSLLVARLLAMSDADPKSGTDQARAILSPPSAPTPSTTPPAVAAPHAPIEMRDRWARDRKGNELPNPEGCVAREVTIWKAEQKPAKKPGGPPFLKVTWQSQDRGYVDANCFDSQLFPWLIKQTGQRTTLHLVRKGEYLNVVGVRA